METYDFENLKTKYGSFRHPCAAVEINGKDLGDSKKGFPVSDLLVDLTSGYEASTAEFGIYQVYDTAKAAFLFDDVKKYILLGSKAEIYLGYDGKLQSVFVGTVTRVNFVFEQEAAPCIRVTAMDVKAIMMAGGYSRQLTGRYYADAVKEILEKTAYRKLQSMDVIRGIHITDTPDKLRSCANAAAAADRSMEMVAESDYEFIVRAAKKNHFEFFVLCGHVYFRRAKSDPSRLMRIGPDTGMRSFDVACDLSGLVEKVTVRAVNVSKAQVISADRKYTNKLSQGNKARPLLKGSRKVCIDASVSSVEEAQERADFLMDAVACRYGSLQCELVGMPELAPGRFVELAGLGTGADNTFYLQRVRHVLSVEGSYVVKLDGVSDGAQDDRGKGMQDGVL